MTSSKQFIKIEWMHKCIMSIPLFHEGFKSYMFAFIIL